MPTIVAFMFFLLLSATRVAPTPHEPRIDAAAESADVTLGDEPGVKVLAESRSFAGLCSEVKPTCIWNGRDLLWVITDARKTITFRLDHAYRMEKADHSPAWALVARDSEFSDRTRTLGYVEKSLVAGKHYNWGDGEVDARALLAAHDDRYGSIYAILWGAEQGRGSGHVIEARWIFVMQTLDLKWKVVGECPGEGSGKNGMEESMDSTAYSIVYTDNVEMPVRVELTFTRTQTELGEQTRGLADREIMRDAILEGPPPATPKDVGRPYTLAHKGDTLDSVTRRMEAWDESNFGDEQFDENRIVDRIWRESIERLNPKLGHGNLAAGTRVTVLSYGDFVDAERPELSKLWKRRRKQTPGQSK